MCSKKKQDIDALELLDKLYEVVKERWRRGSEAFHTEVARVTKPKPRYLKTALYGDVHIADSTELVLLDSFYVQRMKHISHLTFGYHVYPEARHSRFEHSLGTYFLAKRICKSIAKHAKERRFKIDNRACELPIAALLHDIGHGPFSHFTDMVFSRAERRKRDPDLKSQYRDHESRGRDIILEAQKGILTEEGFEFGIRKFLEEQDFDVPFIAESITGETEDPFGPLMNGPIDVDKIDYLIRDSLSAGVPYGILDYDRICSRFRTGGTRRNKQICIDDKAFLAFLQLLLSREISYPAIAYHHVARIASAMQFAATEIALELLESKSQDEEFLRHLELMDDSDLVLALECIGQHWNDYGDERERRKSAIVRNLVHRVKTRQLYKRLAHVRASFFRDMPDIMEGLARVGTIYILPEDIVGELDCLADVFRNALLAEDVILLDVLDIPRAGKIREDLDKIFVYTEGARKRTMPIKGFITERLGGEDPQVQKFFGTDVTDYADIIGRIKLDNWCVILAGPEELQEKEKKTRIWDNLRELLAWVVEKYTPPL